MICRIQAYRAKLILGVIFLFLIGLSGKASPAVTPQGQLSGLILDQAGQPLSDLLVSLLDVSLPGALPILARTNEQGKIYLSEIEAGTYQLLVKSSRYRTPIRRVVNILPGRTAVVTLILQEFFNLDASGEENLSLKALLRNSDNRRLIFRGIPELEDAISAERDYPVFRDAVFQLYTNAGLGSDYLRHPGDSAGGTSTNFAVTDSLPGIGDYIFAGQLNSGQDAVWRFKNFLNYSLGEGHSLGLFFGYGRVSFDQPSLAALNNPEVLQSDPEFTSAPPTARLVSLGIQDSLEFGPALSLTWGVELDRVMAGQNTTLVSPNAAIDFEPVEGTSLGLLSAAKRETRGNSLRLPDGRQINLSDALFITHSENGLNLGRTRYYQSHLRQELGESTEVELAWFRSLMQGAGVPILAFVEIDESSSILHLGEDLSETHGYRMTLRRSLGQNLRAEVSYLQGKGPGLDSGGPAVSSIDQAVSRRTFHAVATQVEAFIPSSDTHLTALVKLVPSGKPIVTLDGYADVYDTGNEGIHLFVRQLIPIPVALLDYFGLDFLAPDQIEALLDIRNLLNEDLGTLHLAGGNLTLLRNPRTVRGGISFKF